MLVFRSMIAVSVVFGYTGIMQHTCVREASAVTIVSVCPTGSCAVYRRFALAQSRNMLS